jgi:hypothetical protein
VTAPWTRCARVSHHILVIAAISVLGACQTVPDDILPPEPLVKAWREAESRRFENVDESLILASAASALQDLGFTVTRTQADAGLLTATKRGSAVNAAQVAGYLILGVMLGSELPWDEEQDIRASFLVRRPYRGGESETIVRLTLQREVRDYNGGVTRLEPVHDDAILGEFFDRLDASLFFEEESL